MTNYEKQVAHPHLRRTPKGQPSPRLGTGRGFRAKDSEVRIDTTDALRSRTFLVIVSRVMDIAAACRRRGLAEQVTMLEDLRACMYALRSVPRADRDAEAEALVHQAKFIENDFFRMARVTPSVGAVAAALEIQGAEDQFAHLLQRITGEVRRRGGKPRPWPLEKLPAEKTAPLAIRQRMGENAARQESGQ
jgi:hypothetical protein